MAMDPTKPWQDAVDPRYAELGPYGSLEQAMAYGVAPVNGMIARGQTMPGTGVDHSTGKMYEPGFTKGGSWQYIGQQDTGMRNPEHGPASTGQWQFVEQQAPQQAAQPMQQEEAPLPKYPEGNIYEDNDYWQGKARAEVEGINKMPGVFSNYADISLMNPKQIENVFYPPAMQEGGVQKTIGPNGQNIGPQLNDMFGDSQAINTKGQSDFPSLVKMLTAAGNIDDGQRQTLLDLMKPKKLDQSFANQMLLGK